MFKINDTIVLTYYYNREKEQITFFTVDGRSICDISMSKEQWTDLCDSCSSTSEIMDELAELFGDATQTNRDWLLNLPVKELIKTLTGKDEVDDDTLFEFIDGVTRLVYDNSAVTCDMCRHPLANDYACNDVEPEPPCLEGFKLYLDEEHR